MDIFKVLSRSTKLHNHGSKSSNPAILPSGGQTSNPQIFGHNGLPGSESVQSSGQSSFGKRKRSGTTRTQEEDELDFFAGNRTKAQIQKREVKGLNEEDDGFEAVEVPTDKGRRNETEETNPSVDIGLDERKRILRSHKIKIMVLAEAQKQENADQKRKSEKSNSKSKKKDKRSVYPKPLESFKHLLSDFEINKKLASNIQEQGYTTPTEVQLAALPLLLGESPLDADGNRVKNEGAIGLLTVAPTGSGKTLAFLIPIVDALLRRKISQSNLQGTDNGKSPSSPVTAHAVVLVPTKELANQIVNEGRKLASGTGLRVALMRKDMVSIETSDPAEDIQEPTMITGSGENNNLDLDEPSDDDSLQDNKTEKSARHNAPKSDIIVSTPLTLVHALQTGKKRHDMPDVQYLILDEADVLLDPLFREQTLDIWHACTNSQLHVSLWSATMGSSIESLALEEMTTGRSHGSILRLVVGIKDTALPTISHNLTYAASEAGKLLAMRQLLHPTSSTSDSDGRKSLRPPFLVFTQTIPRAIALQSELKYDIPPEAGGSNRIAVLHSGLSDSARNRVMTGFRRGEIWVIITTDLLARGVDFKGLNGVVNYDVPTSSAAYVHRVGRTGRAGREGGAAVTFYTKDDIPHVKAIANVISASEKLRDKGEGNSTSTIQQWLLDALPTPSKRDKKELKRRGVESRRIGVKGERISTKSGYDRRRENMRRAPRRNLLKQGGEIEASEVEGFD